MRVVSAFRRRLTGKRAAGIIAPQSITQSCTDYQPSVKTNTVRILQGYDRKSYFPECPVLQPLRLQYAALFTPDTNTMRSVFAQQDHKRVFKFVLDCLDFLNL